MSATRTGAGGNRIFRFDVFHAVLAMSCHVQIEYRPTCPPRGTECYGLALVSASNGSVVYYWRCH